MRPPPLSVLFRRPCIYNNVWPGGAMTTKSGTWIPRHIILAPFPRRGYASDSTLPPPPPQGSLKPKAQTPLRRTAYYSLSILANPKPTQREIQHILTIATSHTYLITHH